jgi:hypothetical protein
MNGPQHYREAERLVSGDESDQRAAQVHATLALAAATFAAGTFADVSQPVPAGAQWAEALS